MKIRVLKATDVARCPFLILSAEHYNDDGTCQCETATCVHCERTIVRIENGVWIDPEADGDDAVWAETCDAHDTFQAEHEPEGESDGAPCCMDPDCPGRRGGTDGCTFPGYADNH